MPIEWVALSRVNLPYTEGLPVFLKILVHFLKIRQVFPQTFPWSSQSVNILHPDWQTVGIKPWMKLQVYAHNQNLNTCSSSTATTTTGFQWNKNNEWETLPLLIRILRGWNWNPLVFFFSISICTWCVCLCISPLVNDLLCEIYQEKPLCLLIWKSWKETLHNITHVIIPMSGQNFVTVFKSVIPLLEKMLARLILNT